MKQIIEKLRELPDEARHEEFFIDGIWYDIYFRFDRDYIREIGGEKDEILTTRVKDFISISDVYLSTKEGEDVILNYNIIHKLETMYNET